MSFPLSSTGNVFPALIEKLDLNRPELVEVREAHSRGDLEKTASALARHFRERPYPEFPYPIYGDRWLSQESLEYMLRDDAEDVLNHTFVFLWERANVGEDIDWCGKYGVGDPEFTWWLNRFYYLQILDETAEDTGNAKYVRKGVELMLDWVRKNPIERAAELNGSWRSLEVGLRLTNWVYFLAKHLASGQIEADEGLVLLHSLWEQAEWLRGVSGPGRANWGFMEQCGIGMVALCFPEFASSGSLVEGVFRTMDQDTSIQVYPDGSQYEMSPHYGVTVILSLMRVLELARQMEVPAPPSLSETMRKMIRYVALILKPDRTVPMKNDGDTININPLFVYAARKFDLPEVLWIVTEGEEGQQPENASMAFPYSGLRVFRNDWSSEGLYLLFDNGPFGTAHQHEDALSIDVSAFGRRFIADPGRYTYPWSPLRRYFLGTRSHATVTVNHQHQRCQRNQETWPAKGPNPDPWLIGEGVILAEGSYKEGYDGADDAIHHRTAIFVNEEYWILRDRIEGTGTHLVSANFNYVPSRLVPASDSSFTTGFEDANLLLSWSSDRVLSATITEGREDIPLGFYSHWYGHLEPAPHLELSTRTPLPLEIFTVLVPYRGTHCPSLSISREETAEGTLLTLRFPEHTDRVTVPPRGSGKKAVWVRENLGE